MKILAVGGGSGGHVTPVVAVLREIRRTNPDSEIRFWCDRKLAHQATQMMGNFDKKIPVQTILAGKLRRYHHLSTIRQLLMPSIVLRNIRDSFLVIGGFIQSLAKLAIWRPDVVFTKGGYVCLPVGMAVRLLGIPLVIHDSDSLPGLTNKLLSKWATAIATGAPLENYPYPKTISRYVGIPIAPEFHKFSKSEQETAKKEWGIDINRPLIVVTGGGLGAKSINDAVAMVLNDLLRLGSVVLVAGDKQYDSLRSITPPNDDHFQLHPFVTKGMASLLGAAEVVVSRAGATFILELAALSKPTILVPNARLTGGHQLKNALIYKKVNAVEIVDEDEMVGNPKTLVSAVQAILTNQKRAREMSDELSKFARPNAARDVASMIISAAK